MTEINLKPGVDYIGVGVGAWICNSKDEVLFLLRSKNAKNEKGKWSIPGGTVEFMETLQDALKREVLEEIGCVIEVEKLLKVVDHILPDEKQHWCNPQFKCRIVSGTPEIREPHKFDGMKWFSLRELPENVTINNLNIVKDIFAGKIKL
ncbi:MAG: NUDIX domain-containing protein [Candidatus Diapherotrites archaeon]|nr:NUDIX domain-containing protein [Candidatus Diapherotrites archaeon]